MDLQETVDELVASGREAGLQVAAYQGGRLLVEAYAGVPGPGTLVHAFSVGKGCTATLVHVLAERGLLEYDAPVARYWPAFGAHGKAGITVRHALTHTAGIPQLPRALTGAELCDWEHMCGVVAGLRPLWEPGTASGYHGWTYGWILGETVRRATGLTPGQALREYVTEPLGIGDELYFGLPADRLARVAPLVEGGWEAYLAGLPSGAPFVRLVAPNRGLWTTATLANRPAYLMADLPACATTTARAAARTGRRGGLPGHAREARAGRGAGRAGGLPGLPGLARLGPRTVLHAVAVAVHPGAVAPARRPDGPARVLAADRSGGPRLRGVLADAHAAGRRRHRERGDGQSEGRGQGSVQRAHGGTSGALRRGPR
ncbi:class A beta-lactamase-related serine hydrolase [Streptomyces sp. WAC07061]|uniref:serine hydrolase domain-containing protein n=1 Tax=Streptomyces sp. WAC07061 TaxID=2487410 RepID=UPI000F76BA6B|nr:serine hydrolase domain-containing protein [Streptomyces sp. WAC07061]RSS43747.1 class A beta-lactamase-related serine hydrolase [Streptomyces sp. WAC07061]